MGNLRLDSVLVAALLVVAATLVTAGPASANPPDDPTLAGANQWSSCHPSESHPRPVILVARQRRRNECNTLASVGGGNHGTTFGERKGLRDKAEPPVCRQMTPSASRSVRPTASK